MIALPAALLLLFAGGALAEFRVVDVQPRFEDRLLAFAGNLELGLTPKVEEALSKGIELSLVIDIKLYRKRAFLWDEKIAAWSLRRRIRYHALASQYLVGLEDGRPEPRESFLSQQEALKYLGSLTDLKLALAEAPAPGEYAVDIRVNLDIEALPAPLRPVAYTTLSWHLNSGWTTWTVAP